MRKIILTSLLLIFILAACSSKPTAPVVTDAPVLPTEPAATLPPTEAPIPAVTEPMATEPPSAADWLDIPLTNVRSGEAFAISDFSGKVILIETFAMWCPKCKLQQDQVKEFHLLINDNPDVVFIGLDIDPNEVAADLKTYIERNDYPWIYAISPAELSRQLSSLYGEQFLNPPATPMLIIDRQGVAHLLPFGSKPAKDLQAAVELYLTPDS